MRIFEFTNNRSMNGRNGAELKKLLLGFTASFMFCCAQIAFPQTNPSSTSLSASAKSSISVAASIVAGGDFAHAAMQKLPWEYGVFFDGGLGVAGKSADHFLNAGVHAGKVLTAPAGPGILRGQFEYAAELMPYWQAFTPKQTYIPPVRSLSQIPAVTTGGTYTGIGMTPVILRWDLVRPQGHWKRALPWLQGAGGLIWTNHKFPPNGPKGTSVWNFTPQFGVGLHYFLKPDRAITFAANAVHISSASLGDSNPGVNATVQFQIGYTWWK